jgi:nucleoside-diphosphate-sugar epimerase
MRVLVAGATGAIGRPLLPRLMSAGHEVVGMTRSEAGAERVRTAGAEPVVCDALDPSQVHEGVRAARPEVLVHQLTAIPESVNPRKLADQFELTDRLRTEGTRYLIAAGREAGARRIVAQSIAFAYAPEGGRVKHEDAPLNLDAPRQFRRTARALEELERQVGGAEGLEGVVLRYGVFYGPGTPFAIDGSTAQAVRRRAFPQVGRGTGTFSFIHVEDAADATLRAVDGGAPGVYNIVDDDPVAVSDWLPEYARILGAKPPRRVPKLVATLAVGAYGAQVMTELRGASNEKAKRELGWSPRRASWREGFREALG